MSSDQIPAQSPLRRSEGIGSARPPRLTFACELDAPRLADLLADPAVIANLQALKAGVALALADFAPERTAIVKRLHEHGIAVTAIPLLPADEGYYFTADNCQRAMERYTEWKLWTDENELVWEAVGLDIEADVRLYQQIAENPWRLPALVLPRLRDTHRPRRAREAYEALVERIHADGYRVENYQFPFMEEERRAGSTLIERLMGLVDVRTDREVWMLYTSFLPGIGPVILWAYAPEAGAIAVGSTGGGPDIPGHPQVPALNWEELSRDLLLSHRWSDDLYIHSLEGCVWQDFLPRLYTLDWEQAVRVPRRAVLGQGMRVALRGLLRLSAHPYQGAALCIVAIWLLMRNIRRRQRS